MRLSINKLVVGLLRCSYAAPALPTALPRFLKRRLRLCYAYFEYAHLSCCLNLRLPN